MKLGQNVLDIICENVKGSQRISKDLKGSQRISKEDQKSSGTTTDCEAENEILVSALDLPSE